MCSGILEQMYTVPATGCLHPLEGVVFSTKFAVGRETTRWRRRRSKLVEAADANLKGLVSDRLSSFEKNPEMLESSDFRKMLRYNTKLMQKIQLKENQKLKEAAGTEVSEVD